MRRIPWILAAGWGCGSSPPVEPAPASAEVTVTTPAGVTMCAGTRTWADAEVARVQAVTGLVPDFPLTVELGVAAVARACGGDPEAGVRLGCAVGNGAQSQAFAEPAAFAHELSHALRRQYGLATVAVFEEGFAESVNGSDPYPSTVVLEAADAEFDLASAVSNGADVVGASSYRASTHFFRWLAERHGEEAVARFMTGGIDASPADAENRFAQAFGQDVVDAAEESAAPVGTVAFRGRLCREAVPLAASATLDATVDCGAPDTYGLSGPGEPAWTRRCFSAPSTTPFAVSLEGARGRVELAVDPVDCAVPVDDPSRTPRVVRAGETMSWTLAGCAWAATFIVEEPESTSLALRLSVP
ncbi:MAG: hypothetical protein AAF721_35150 [Myxococcota bacterium]